MILPMESATVPANRPCQMSNINSYNKGLILKNKISYKNKRKQKHPKKNNNAKATIQFITRLQELEVSEVFFNSDRFRNDHTTKW